MKAIKEFWTDLQQEKMTRAIVKGFPLLASDEDIWSTLLDGSDGWPEGL